MSVKTLNADLDQTVVKARIATQGLRGLAGAGFAARQSVGVGAPAAPGGPGRDDQIVGLLGQVLAGLPERPPNAAIENRRQQP
jgi:hypothetical protein